MFRPTEARDAHGRWISAYGAVAHRLDVMAEADGGPDRIHMPQLSGVPAPGSKADRMFPGRAPGSEVDLTEEFQTWLGRHGVKVTDTEVPSSVLRPTQDQLIESKVVGLAKFMEKAPPTSPVFEPIFTTADNHVIDGHHRWAANEVRNEVDGVPRWMKVRQVQANVPQSLALATKFMDEYGLPRVGMTDTTAVSTFAKKVAAAGATMSLSTPVVSAQDGPRMATPSFGGKKAAPFVKNDPNGKKRAAKMAVAKARLAQKG